MKSILVIINPIAGTPFRKLNHLLIDKYFPATEYNVEISTTTHQGHAKELAAKAVEEKVDIVIIAGGDGSVNEVGTVLKNTPVQLGIIPTGSGNGLAHHLRIPININKAIQSIKTGIIQKIDVGVVQSEVIGEHFFLSNCGFGYDAEVIHAYSEVPQRGFFTYLYFMFKSIFTLKPKQATIQFHEFKETLKPFVFTVANSSQYGYKIEVAPDASISDGILDALLVKDATTLRVIKFSILSMLKLRDKVLDVADFYKTKDITINFEEETKLQIDGEPHFVSGELKISIDKQALQIFIPSRL